MKGVLDPVAWCWFCLIALGVWLFRRPERGLGVLLLVVALGWSLMEWFAVPARLLASREEPYVGRGVAGLDEDAESFDAVVMLGGVLMPSPRISLPFNSMPWLLRRRFIPLLVTRVSSRPTLKVPTRSKGWLRIRSLGRVFLEAGSLE